MGVSVIRKFAGLLTLVMAAFVVAPGLVASASAADDPYTNGVRTSCHISVPAVVQVGRAPRIRITVRPNAPAAGARAAQRAARPKGTVHLRITKGGSEIFSRTVAYNGSTVTVVGPVVTEPGHYVVHARFRTDDGSTFKSCHSTTAFDVRQCDGPGPGPGPDPGIDNPDGLLPDTGGPNLMWLLLGLALVVSGAGLVVAARDRSQNPYLV
jgi:hypothetical protein